MENIVKPVACKILEVKRESLHEYTYRVETDIKPEHGQFLQLSIPQDRGSAHLGEFLWGRLYGFYHPFRGQGDRCDI